MAKKISTLILTVNLECDICTKMIKKAIGKLQDRENIQSVVYDEKNGIITVSGKFDPNRLSKKLCCTACKVIKDIRVKPDEPPPKPAPKPEAPKPAPPAPEQPKPAPAPPPAAPPPTPKPAPAPAEPKPTPVAPKQPEPAPPAPEPEKTKPAPKKPELQCPYPYPYPYPCPYPYPVAWPFGPTYGCGCQTGWCHCKPTAEPPPPASSPIPTCATPNYWDGYRTCKFICEEEPSACSIM